MKKESNPNTSDSNKEKLLMSTKRISLSNASSAANSSRAADLLIEFKKKRASGLPITARELILQSNLDANLDENREVAIDLLFAEYLDDQKLGRNGTLERLLSQFPQFADELQRQVHFHSAIQELETPGDRLAQSGNDSIELVMDAEDAEFSNSEAAEFDQAQLPRIPGLKFLRPIGRGGMGVVYLAFQADLNRCVAVKLLLGGSLASKSHRARFRAEAKAAASLRHPNIVQIDDVGEAQGQPYIVMEYVDGGTLAEYANDRKLNATEAARLMKTLARAIHEAHLNGIIHRDLKPGNILLSRQLREDESEKTESSSNDRLQLNFVPKIADFGLAKLMDDDQSGPALTLAGDLLGTPSFMAPEQTSGVQNIGPWTDVYSLGAILYQLLAGRPPFLESNAWDTLQQVINTPPAPLPGTVPRDLRIICEICLSKESQRRFKSMSDLAGDLQNFLENRPISASRPTVFQKSVRWCQRNRTVATLGGLVFVSLISLLVSLTWSRSRLLEMLNQTRQAQRNEASSHATSLSNLWDAIISEAKAIQTSGQIGQRFESLKKIEEAQHLIEKVGATEERKALLRDTALAALPLVDLKKKGDWSSLEWRSEGFTVDQSFERVARITQEGKIIVSDVFENKVSFEFLAHDARGLQLSNDGKRLAVWGENCYVRNLDDERSVIPIAESSLGWWVFTPDGERLIGFDNKGLLITNLSDNSSQRLQDCEQPEVPLCVSPDGRMLAILNSNKLQVIDLDGVRRQCELAPPESSILGPSLAWHPNCRYLAAVKYEGDFMVVWDIDNATQFRRFKVDGNFFNLAFDSSGKHIMACSQWSGDRVLFDIERNQPVLSFPFPLGLRIGESRTGKEILALSATEQKTELFQLTTPTVLRSLSTAFGPLIFRTTIDRSSDGRWVAVCADNGIEIYDGNTSQCVANLPVGKMDFEGIRFDLSNRLWGTRENGWCWWKVEEEGIHAPEWVPADEGWRPIAVSPDGKWGLLSNSREVRLQNFFDPNKSVTLGDHPDVRSACFNHDATLVAVGAQNEPAGVKIFDVRSKKLIKTLDIGRFCKAEFSVDGKWLYTSPKGGEIWNVATWERHLSLKSPDEAETGLGFAFSPDSQWCVHTNGIGKLKIQSLESCEVLAELTDPHQDRYERLLVSLDQRFLFGTTSAGSRSFKQWNLQLIRSEVAELGIKLASFGNPIPGDRSGPRIEGLSSLKVETNALFESMIFEEALQQVSQLFKAQRWQEGLTKLESAQQITPNSADLNHYHAWVLLTLPQEYRNPLKGLDLANRAVDLKGATELESSYLKTLGIALFRTGSYEDAIDLLKKSFESAPENLQVYELLILAGCHAELGNVSKALTLHSEAEERFQQFSGSYPATTITEIEMFRREIGELIRFAKKNNEADKKSKVTNEKH